MAKILIESGDDGKGVAEAIMMDGNAGDLASLMTRAAAVFILQAKKPESSMYETCIAFGVSVYRMAVELMQRGQVRPGIYIEKGDAK